MLLTFAWRFLLLLTGELVDPFRHILRAEDHTFLAERNTEARCEPSPHNAQSNLTTDDLGNYTQNSSLQGRKDSEHAEITEECMNMLQTLA